MTTPAQSKTEMEKTYEPAAMEQRWYDFWEAQGYFKPRGSGTPYTILLPPPNVTGTLHMGHAFQHTLMDALLRYRRMRGDDVLWQVGCDHAGIATEMVVSRQLKAAGQSRDGLGREAFIARVWEWKRQSGGTIEQQMRRLGASADWTCSVFTMDEMPTRAVLECFVRLYDEGLIYRGQRLVNWDPVLKTAISDLEVINHEEEGTLWTILYPFSDPGLRGPDGRPGLAVATTRPETLLGDVCVAVHPDDERYRAFIGKNLKLPLTTREIPVIADDYVDREFGTGCVKITPAHDFNDYEVGKRHRFAPLNVFTPAAAINDNGPEHYRGLDRYAARRRIVEDLKAEGLLLASQPHKLQIPRGDRSGEVIEPYLTDQWFVRMDGLAQRGLELAEKGKVRFVPENWINTYRHWLEHIEDWCISRQLWWGHRIPAWYDPQGKVYVGRDEAEVRRRHALDEKVSLTQDEDVLETWFSSALWPFSTLGWPDEVAMAARGYDRRLPSSVLVTGFDILFFWVARMIMMTDHFTQRLPFHEVYITGLVRDKDGQKMSKSKGNILDPIDLIDGIALNALIVKRTTGLMQPEMAERIAQATRHEFADGIPAFGADALRFTFAALATGGRDIKFDLQRCEGYRHFCNKLWNAARFVMQKLDTGPAGGSADVLEIDPSEAGYAERWIASRLSATISAVDEAYATYRFDLAAQAIYDFTWNEFCDWYLELAKPQLADDAEAAQSAATRRCLITTLDALLRLIHPFMPFISEEIWQRLRAHINAEHIHAAPDSLMVAPWPAAGGRDHEAEAEIDWVKSVILAVRGARTELNLAPGKPLPVIVLGGGVTDRRRWQQHQIWLGRLARIAATTWQDSGEPPPDCALALAGEFRIAIPLAGLIDRAAEIARLSGRLEKAEADAARSAAKLANERFVAHAPPAVVDQERQRLAQHRATCEQLRAQLKTLGHGRTA